MTNIPKNPEYVRMFACWTSFAFFLFVAVIWVVLPPLRVCFQNNWGGTLLVALAMFPLVALSAALMATHHWFAFRHLVQPDNLLALWYYSEQEWKKHGQGKPVFVVAGFLGLGLLLTYETCFQSLFSTLLALVICGSLIGATAWISRHYARRGPRFCLLARKGCYISSGMGSYTSWRSPASLDKITLNEKNGCTTIEINYYVGSRRFTTTLPVPAGHEIEAEHLLPLIG